MIITLPSLEGLPNGTIFVRRGQMYVVSQGLDGRIVQNTNTGFWFFLDRLNWRTVDIRYNPGLDPMHRHGYPYPG